MPHLEVGLDLSFLQVTARTQYVHMIPTRDDSLSEMSYLHSGVGLLGYFKVMGFSLEIDGLFNIDNAAAIDAVEGLLAAYTQPSVQMPNTTTKKSMFGETSVAPTHPS